MSSILASAGSDSDAGPARKVTVIGSGAFGTSMATVAARNGHQVTIYARCADTVRSINERHINSKYLSEFELLPNITATTDVATALEGVELLMLSLPAQTISEWLEEHKSLIGPNVLVCNTAKGLHLKTKKLLSEVIANVLGANQPYALLSGMNSCSKLNLDVKIFLISNLPLLDQYISTCTAGPSFAKEILQKYPTAVVVACKFLYHAVTIQRMLSSSHFRVYTSQDVIGKFTF